LYISADDAFVQIKKKAS